MTTLANIRSQVADDLARSDLTTQISEAIAEAVRKYEIDRFHFNEFRRVTATLSSGATSIPFSQLGITPLKVDRVSLLRSSTYFAPLAQVGAAELEDLRDVQISTEPGYWALDGDAIRFDCSAASDYTVVVDGIKQIASASASADTTSTAAWFNEARDLIRAAAKKSLYLHVIKDDEEASRANAAEMEALGKLRERTINKRATGYVRPVQF